MKEKEQKYYYLKVLNKDNKIVKNIGKYKTKIAVQTAIGKYLKSLSEKEREEYDNGTLSFKIFVEK